MVEATAASMTASAAKSGIALTAIFAPIAGVTALAGIIAVEWWLGRKDAEKIAAGSEAKS